MITFDIYAHADFSARHRASKYQPGMTAFASFVDSLRQNNKDGALLLSAGDEFSSSFWGGEPIVKGMELIGTDAMTLGNHEFDRGQDFIENCIKAANFPILCANVYERATNAHIKGTKPYVIIEKQGVKIGIVGVTTDYTPYMVTAAAIAPFEVRPCVDACKKYIPLVRQEGAEIVVLLTHIPFYIDEKGDISGELKDLLDAIPPVDVCMGGHIPGDYAGTYNNPAANGAANTVVMKGGFGGKSLCHAILEFDDKKRRLVYACAKMEHTPWDIAPVAHYKSYFDAITEPHKGFFEDVLASTDKKWNIRLSRECGLGNFFAQCVEEEAGVDFAYMNATSSGGGFDVGPITAEDVTMTLGFNDPIMLSEMSGKEIIRLFELVHEPERYGNNAGLFFSGVIVNIDHTKKSPNKVISVTLRDGTAIEEEKLYTVATSEYMASGGNDTGELANKRSWTKSGKRMYDAVFAVLKRYGKVNVSAEKRMVETGTPENDNAPF